ncbi:hypothetical protein EAH75_01415 [Rhodanobacter glycinis]|uniref:hypothetical protein n=1 Tax=Rhodanobacter glycinis TaxID=582702 RepID=UPI00112C023A|nr:hypothetical protein [Rhodanobacter glycinis]TPG50183.1 hypothetical protein EAH75_01415 [Rhodanobacter glycinis]
MTDEVEQVVPAVEAEAVVEQAPAVAEPVSPAVSAATSHVYGLIEHLKSEFLVLEEKFNKAIADLRSHL